MLKLIVRKTRWSDNKASQEAYERGRIDQAAEDAKAVVDWLINRGQMNSWLNLEVEVLEDESES